MNQDTIDVIDKWLLILRKKRGEFHFKLVYQAETGANESNYKTYDYNAAKILLIHHALMRKNPQGTFDTGDVLTPLGEEIADAGGWHQYFKKQKQLEYIMEEDRNLTRRLAESTLELNEKTQGIYAFQRAMTILTITVAAVAAIATAVQAYLMLNNK